MKKIKIYVGILSAFLMTPILVSGQIQTPAASPSASVSTQVGLTDIEIDYYRPKAKDRKIFGEGSAFLVPFGEIWRTGANAGTKISFSDDVKIMDKDVKAGEYMIYTIPGKDEWQVMLYSDLKLGGNTGGYDEANEVARFTVKPSSTGSSVEALTFQIEDLSADSKSAEIAMTWENTKIELPVTVSYDDKILAQIDDLKAKIEKGEEVDLRNLMAAASYYYETNRDLDQALEWTNSYLEKYPNQFWFVHLKAQILAKSGDEKAAIEAAKKSMELAKASESDFGYVKRNEDLISDLQKN